MALSTPHSHVISRLVHSMRRRRVVLRMIARCQTLPLLGHEPDRPLRGRREQSLVSGATPRGWRARHNSQIGRRGPAGFSPGQSTRLPRRALNPDCDLAADRFHQAVAAPAPNPRVLSTGQRCTAGADQYVIERGGTAWREMGRPPDEQCQAFIIKGLSTTAYEGPSLGEAADRLGLIGGDGPR